MLVALLVCLIPTTIGALLSAIGIAGMDRLVQHNVLAMSGRAVEAAGDVNTLLLDKTGTITLGNRQAAEFLPVAGVPTAEPRRRGPAVQPGRRDPRGPLDRRAGQDRLRPAGTGAGRAARRAHFVAFTAQTRMSGVDLAGGRQIRKGAAAAVAALGPRQRRAPDRARSATIVDAHLHRRRHAAGRRRARRRARPARSASSTSRTSSRRACASGSTRCAGWASAP